MSVPSIEDLIKAGLHFGHAASSWNPKMKPFIHGVKKKIHILDLKQTVKSLVSASHLVNQYAAQGKKFLFVGTKPQAQELVAESALKTENFFVAERWLGGLLTNHSVALKRLDKLEELEDIENEHAEEYSKKVLSSIKRNLKKLYRGLNGVRGMSRLPDLLIVIDPKHEHLAIKEATICGIPVIALTDSNCDPSEIDLVIPGNDDAVRGIDFVLKYLTESILDGQKELQDKKAALAPAPLESPVELGVSQTESPKKEVEAKAETSETKPQTETAKA